MREEAEQRLRRLRADYEVGQVKLAEVEQQALVLRETLLRISGAIQVLEELLAEGNGHVPDDESATITVGE
ncbi:hypothetical protein ACFVAV_17700 [Nocardia sp. NPDC057663]|uniref:hypothetical protein n=1 Tax=Nocardia sp. NPDC057663 TaxID=3346201 RepID=UPI00366F8611